jgi:hypothetical protein
MALELKFTYSISEDRTKLVVTDSTGVYSVNNTTGWGTPNLNRNEVGLYCYVTYQPFDKPLETVTNITPVFDIDNTYTNDYVSTFEFQYSKDGWYRIALVALTQAEYDAVTNPESLINSEIFPNVFTEDILMVNLIIQKNCLLEKYIECLNCNTCKCDIAKEDVVKVNLLIQAIDYRFHSSKQSEAQKMLELLTKQYKCC